MERYRGGEKQDPHKGLRTGPDAAREELRVDAFIRSPKIKRTSVRLPRPPKENPNPGVPQ